MSETASVPITPSKTQVFLRRSISTLILWTIVIWASFSGNRIVSDGFFLLFIAVMALTGLLEFYGMARKIGLPCFKVSGAIGGMLLMIGTFLNVTGFIGTANGSPARVNDFETSFLILFVLGLCIRQFVSKSNRESFAGIGVTLLGLMYVPWLLNFVQQINFFPGLNGGGKYFVLYYILVTKFSDTGAYVVGSLIGRHKMIPRISPGKTWEGFGGAIVVSTGASLAFTHLLNARMIGMDRLHAIILGEPLRSTAVHGDLIESLFKREAGVKDSGRTFPGIGGILDLLDSLLFNAPIMYLYLRHVLTSQ